MNFAEGTTVSVEKTQAEIAALAKKHGATDFGSGWNSGEAGLTFVIKSRRVKFIVRMPGSDDKAIRAVASRGHGGSFLDRVQKAVQAEERRRWRCLLLAIKAKLEIVATGISTFDEEFLSHIVTDTGQTVFERLRSGPDSSRLLPAIGD